MKLPSVRKSVRLVRKFAGRLLDSILVLDFVCGLRSNQVLPIDLFGFEESYFFGNDSRHLSACVYSVYAEDKLRLRKIQSDVSILLEKFNYVFIVNTGSQKLQIGSHSNIYIWNRKNIGRDIFSYSIVARFLIEKKYLGSVTFLNDSIDFTSKTLEEAQKAISIQKGHIYSATVSDQKNRHMQTFFVVVPSSLTVEVLEVIEQLRGMKFKRAIVRYGEIRLSEILHARGIQFQPLVSNDMLFQATMESHLLKEELKKRISQLFYEGVHLNPCIHFWPGLRQSLQITKRIYDV